jgi:sensor histidine kinase YesM
LKAAQFHKTRLTEEINDKWVRIGSVALLSINILFTYHREGTGFNGPPFYIGYYLTCVIVLMETNRGWIRYFHKKIPLKQSRKRFWATTAVVTLNSSIIILYSFYFYHWIRGIHTASFFVLFPFITLSSFILACVQTGIYEALYYARRLGQLEAEKEELLRINLQSQYDSLKQQVNPHFLFNSINTVSSLISLDPDRAKKFLSEMSKVYRYLLQSNQQELVTVETEIRFIESYFHLLKTRFNEGLIMKLDIDDCYKHYLLPALTLQLLIENAIKHNIVEKGRALTITITAAEGKLTVRNNLQKKSAGVYSTKIGLANIIAKYQLLQQPEVMIWETDEEFKVVLPLIQKKEHDYIDRRG